MCGIAGFIKADGLKDYSVFIDKFASSLHHRGPDGYGVFENEDLALIHTRLSIIDLSTKGNQPLKNEDNSLVLICNGEIYNYVEIRSDLIKKGHKFHSSSDSEVILHLYEELDGDFSAVLKKLTGMFAFSLLDISRKKLFIARDRIGIKPLYYHVSDKNFLFASEVSPIATCGLISVSTDPTSIFEYFLLGSVPEPNSWFKEIKALSPGHFGIWENNLFREQNYWDIPSTSTVGFNSVAEVAEASDSLLSCIVSDHLVADVPVGTFLSAGIDSSLISYYAAKENNGIHSFSAAFPGEPEDESIIASQTANSIGATHETFDINTDFFGSWSSHYGNLDQPFGVSSALSLSRISALAKSKVKVVLSGDGADELMGGYDRHVPFFNPPVLQGFPISLRSSLLKYTGSIFGIKSFKEASAYLQINDSIKYLDRYRILEEEKCLEMINPALRSLVDVNRYKKRIQGFWEECAGEDLLTKMLYLDLKTSLVDEMLAKVDRMTMNQGIEARVPFLDHRFVEFSFAIPSQFKQNEKWGKLPLRFLVEKHLNSDLAYRKKTGFNSPLKSMLCKDLPTRNLYLSKVLALKNSELLNKEKLSELLKEHSDCINPSLAFGLVALESFLKIN
ncbi:asparagine synthase (glutamine-hydrolyzing) [Algoriphagus sp.]|uniref:asparagine synthase (glutamine-hydrolyzing) n=1 Tax=Algoriphagus sp. TaxID=1872435 RepID=UPI003918FB65